jgi:tripartite-type tricarboxylate transporter receptor subunit TctC
MFAILLNRFKSEGGQHDGAWQRALAGALVSISTLFALPAGAQSFPDHALKLVVPFPPGGATDTLGRILAKKMGELLNQPFVVENKGGAGGTIGTEYLARQPADGYAVLLVNAIPHTASRKLYPVNYDPVKSFAPIGALGTVRYILAINNEVPAKDYAQFVQLLKKEPGKYNFATAGVGTAPHLAMELWMRTAGVEMVHVPYQGSGPAITDLMGTRVQAIIENVPLVPLIKANKVRALAITGKVRSPNFPDLPTFVEVGLPAFEMTGTWGLIAPAGVPPDRVTILSNALANAVKDPTVRDALIAQGIDPESGSAAEFGAILVRESDKWSKVIDEAKIKL